MPPSSHLIRSGCLLCLVASLAAAQWQQHAIDASGGGADGVRLADANGDGLLDIVTGWEDGNHRVMIYLHPGHAALGSAWPSVQVAAFTGVEDAVLVDLDDDGRLDVVSSSEGSGRTMRVHWAPTDPADYSDPAAWTTGELGDSSGTMSWMFCIPLDVDGSHGIDLVAGGKESGAAVGWWQAPADPRDLSAWTWHQMSQAGWVMALIAEDMDGDGDADVLLTDRKNYTAGRGIRWLENPGTGSSAQTDPWAWHWLPTPAAAEVQTNDLMFSQIVDVDGDGLRDVVAAAKGKGVLYCRRLDASGDSWTPFWLRAPDNEVRSQGTGAKAVAVADYNGDGIQDVAVNVEDYTDSAAPGVFLLTDDGTTGNDGSGKLIWNVEVIDGVGGKYDLLQAVDVDGDGDLDLITCEEYQDRGVFWLENPFDQGGADGGDDGSDGGGDDEVGAAPVFSGGQVSITGTLAEGLILVRVNDQLAELDGNTFQATVDDDVGEVVIEAETAEGAISSRTMTIAASGGGNG
jgi:hypothetical protein